MKPGTLGHIWLLEGRELFGKDSVLKLSALVENKWFFFPLEDLWESMSPIIPVGPAFQRQLRNCVSSSWEFTEPTNHCVPKSSWSHALCAQVPHSSNRRCFQKLWGVVLTHLDACTPVGEALRPRQPVRIWTASLVIRQIQECGCSSERRSLSLLWSTWIAFFQSLQGWKTQSPQQLKPPAHVFAVRVGNIWLWGLSLFKPSTFILKLMLQSKVLSVIQILLG